MARPEKEDAEKRDRWFKVRVTESEAAAIKARAEEAQKRPSDFAREMLLGGSVRVVNAPPALSVKETVELNRIGVNLNQLMSVAHATGQMPAGLEPVLALLNTFLNKAMGLDTLDEPEDDSARRIAG